MCLEAVHTQHERLARWCHRDAISNVLLTIRRLTISGGHGAPEPLCAARQGCPLSAALPVAPGWPRPVNAGVPAGHSAACWGGVPCKGQQNTLSGVCRVTAWSWGARVPFCTEFVGQAMCCRALT